MSISADPHSLDIDTRTYSDGHSRTSSEDHYPKVPYFDENFMHTSPRILMSSSNFSESDSSHVWDDVEKRSNGNSEDQCREVRCIETEEASYKGGAIAKTGVPKVKVTANGEGQNGKPLSPPSRKDDNGNEMKEDTGFGIVPSGEQEFSSIRFLDTPSLEKLSLAHDQDNNSSRAKNLKLTKSRSCKASMTGDSVSPWFKMIDFSENTPSFGTERESVSFERKISPLSFSSNVQLLSRKDSQSFRGNALDIEIDTPNVKFASAEDSISSTAETREKAKLPIEQEAIKNPVS